MQTLTRYLSNIMNSTLLALPREIKELIYFDALSHAVARILVSFICQAFFFSSFFCPPLFPFIGHVRCCHHGEVFFYFSFFLVQEDVERVCVFRVFGVFFFYRLCRSRPT